MSPALRGKRDAIFPGVVSLPELAHIADTQGFPVRLLQVGQQLIHRADLAAVPGFHGRLDHLGKALDVAGERRRVRPAVLDAVAQLAIGVEIEGGSDLAAADDDHAARAQRMAHAEFVPDVGIGEGEISHHQIGDEQFLEHVGADVAGAFLFVRAEDFEPRGFQRRLDQFVVDLIEIDHLPIRPRFAAERHSDKGV